MSLCQRDHLEFMFQQGVLLKPVKSWIGQVFVWGLHFCWIMTCVLLIAEPPQVKRLNMVRANRIVPVVMMLGIIVGMSYIQSPLEQGAAVGRSVTSVG